jgi:hypothetical protein
MKMNFNTMMNFSAACCAMMLMHVPGAMAQSPGGAVNEPVIDLAGAAKRVREGQVVPPEGPEGSERIGGGGADDCLRAHACCRGRVADRCSGTRAGAAIASRWQRRQRRVDRCGGHGRVSRRA